MESDLRYVSNKVFFGDSITKEYVSQFEKTFKNQYPEVDAEFINAGVVGETSRDGLKRLPELLDKKPDVVIIGFGMNDWRKGVDKAEYKKNIIKMVDDFERIGTRVIVNTVSPSFDFSERKYNHDVDQYSEIVREIGYEKRVKIADINALWKRELKRPEDGLRDDLHPNSLGYEIICKCLMWYVPRKNTTILWQYNGREAKCNYRCPYCYYIGLHSPKDRFFGTIEDWRNAFKESFGSQNLYVYLGFGEPTLGKAFSEIIKMFESEKKWQLRVISNLDTEQARNVAKSNLAKEGRLHIVGSFHPCATTKEEYLKHLLYFRENGIEIPTVYVGYPPYLKHFQEDIEFFRKHNFLIHVRRLQGYYKNKKYPQAYSEEEAKLIAKYMDDGMLKYMKADVSCNGKLTYSGVHFFVVDNVGNVGYDSNLFQPYTQYRCIFGNLFQGNFRPLLLPGPYPGVSEGTDDGVANIIENGYKELEYNHVMSFARQGGVYKDKDGKVIYGNEYKDFDDPFIRAEYNFPPRNISEKIAVFAQNSLKYHSKIRGFIKKVFK